jgi:dUTP pyrophosphatase
MSIPVKIINQSIHPLPAYASTDAAGMDLKANIPQSISLQPLERQLIPTGIFIELPPGYEAQVRPRSGLALKQGITCLNSPGTVDADYRGELKDPDKPSDSEVYSPGTGLRKCGQPG